MDAFTAHVDCSSLKIDTQLRAFELRKRFFRTGPSQGRSDTCQELAYCKGIYTWLRHHDESGKRVYP